MATSLKGINILDENGQPVEGDALEEFLDTTDVVYFEVTNRGGKKLKFAILVDTSRVTVEDMARYRRAMAQASVDADQEREALKAKYGIENDDDGDDKELEPSDLAKLLEFAEQTAEIQAAVLCKLVVESNYPGKNFAVPETLTERTGAGPAALQALNSYFFGDSIEPEEETGTTETAPTESASDSSEATDNSEVIPPTS